MPKNDCTKCNKRIVSNLNSIKIVPFDTNMSSLFSYFLHQAPNIESVSSCKLPIKFHDKIFYEMLEHKHFVYYFQSPYKSIDDLIQQEHMTGNNICLKCRRFVCRLNRKKKNEEQRETNLECLLRHIRNAIAHGRVYCVNAGNNYYLMFDDKNDSGVYTARIICTRADLKKWKEILQKAIEQYT